MTVAVVRKCGWTVGVTLLLGLATAGALAAGLEAGERRFAALSDPVQSMMSVTVPLVGILLVRDRTRIVPSLLAAVLVAAAVGTFGAVLCAAVAAGGAADPWRHAPVVAIGGVLVQALAVLIGTGLGLLVRPVPLAFLATFLPLLVWFVLGAVLRPAQDWLTPYQTARHLLSGDMSALAWLQWLVVVLLWGVALNAAGAKRHLAH